MCLYFPNPPYVANNNVMIISYTRYGCLGKPALLALSIFAESVSALSWELLANHGYIAAWNATAEVAKTIMHQHELATKQSFYPLQLFLENPLHHYLFE